ncbi:unnamed protein product [Dibothriocephalus latus]|uniref:Intraflagellar transport protein 46 homolog n=1 Tax=Dibothriocephalus latus TaxID=60516 RepID=A0A3P7LUZ3_DIBLA|nr:unnamed protein product [Dibothriocephalus latus]
MPAGSPGDDSELMKAAPDPKLSASIRQIPSPASEDARNGPGGSSRAAERGFRGRGHGKGTTSKSKLSNNSANLMDESTEGDDDDEDDEEEEDEEDDDDETNTEVIEGMYNPADYEHLIVSAEVKEMFHYIQRYTPQSIDLDTKLRPFIPEYIAAVGDIDAFLKVSPSLNTVLELVVIRKSTTTTTTDLKSLLRNKNLLTSSGRNALSFFTYMLCIT